MSEPRTLTEGKQPVRHSLQVQYSDAEFLRLVKEVQNSTIAEVHFTLFVHWIRLSRENYEQTKEYIRELGFAQNYNTERVENEFVRRLLNDTKQMRPEWTPLEPNTPIASSDVNNWLSSKEPKVSPSPGSKSLESLALESTTTRSSSSKSPGFFSSLPRKSKSPWLSKMLARSPSRTTPAPLMSPSINASRSSLSSSSTAFRTLSGLKKFSKSEVSVTGVSTSLPPPPPPPISVVASSSKMVPRSSGIAPRPKTPMRAKTPAGEAVKTSRIPFPASLPSKYTVFPPDTPDRPAPLRINKPRSAGQQTGTRTVSAPLQISKKTPSRIPAVPARSVARAVSTPHLANRIRSSTLPRYACSPTLSSDKAVQNKHNGRGGEAQKGTSSSSASKRELRPPQILGHTKGTQSQELENLFASLGLPSRTTPVIVKGEREDGPSQPKLRSDKVVQPESQSDERAQSELEYHENAQPEDQFHETSPLQHQSRETTPQHQLQGVTELEPRDMVYPQHQDDAQPGSGYQSDESAQSELQYYETSQPEQQSNEFVELEGDTPTTPVGYPSSHTDERAKSEDGSVFEDNDDDTVRLRLSRLSRILEMDEPLRPHSDHGEPSSSAATSTTRRHTGQSYPPFGNILNSPGSRLGFVAQPAPTPAERRAATQARRAAHPVNPALSTIPGLFMNPNFNRPLPLRSYDSQFQKALSETSTTTACSAVQPESDRPAAVLHFPRAPARSDSTSVLSPRDIYRSVTETYMQQALNRTRARGSQLDTVDLRALPSFERAWRTVNEQLLVAIYGRNDVVLSEKDVELVDKIAKELGQGVGQIRGYEWVGEIFQPRL